MQYELVGQHKVNKKKGLLFDKTIRSRSRISSKIFLSSLCKIQLRGLSKTADVARATLRIFRLTRSWRLREIGIKIRSYFERGLKLTGADTGNYYPKDLRIVGYKDPKTGKEYVFLTNNFKLAAYTIAQIYKARWQIEIFFKWIKQHLKIKSFFGTSKNAVMTQVWIAMCCYPTQSGISFWHSLLDRKISFLAASVEIWEVGVAYLLLAYIKYQTKYSYPLLELTRIIAATIFDRIILIDLLSCNRNNIKRIRSPGNQSLLF